MPKRAELMVIRGPEGYCLCLNSYRLAGPKPWGGGEVVAEWEVEESEIRVQLSAEEEAQDAETVRLRHECADLEQINQRLDERCAELEAQVAELKCDRDTLVKRIEGYGEWPEIIEGLKTLWVCHYCCGTGEHSIGDDCVRCAGSGFRRLCQLSPRPRRRRRLRRLSQPRDRRGRSAPRPLRRSPVTDDEPEEESDESRVHHI